MQRSELLEQKTYTREKKENLCKARSVPVLATGGATLPRHGINNGKTQGIKGLEYLCSVVWGEFPLFLRQGLKLPRLALTSDLLVLPPPALGL